MNSLKSYKRLSPEEKKVLILRYLTGEPISRIAKDAGVSRTIFYKWLKEYQSRDAKSRLHNQVFMPKNPKGRKHWHKLKNAKEDKIVSLWKNNPQHTIRQIAELSDVSLGAAWKIINEYKKQAEKNERKLRRYKKKSYIQVSPSGKIELIRRYQLGESIAKISRDSGISRTIFYKWLREYGKSNHPETFRKQNPKGEKHWRFMENVHAAALELISQNPKLSLSQLMRSIHQEGIQVSKSGLYYILKRMELDTYQARLTYATALNATAVIPIRRTRIAHRRMALPAFFVLILTFFALFIFIPPIKISTPFMGINPSPTQTVSDKGQIGKDMPQEETEAPERAEQDLSWGGLSVNTPRDTYKEDENVEMGFGIVDHAGNTICDADISFEVVNPQGNIVYEKSRVPESGECSLQSVTNTPDYLLKMPGFEEEGEYTVRIKARTYNGEKDFKTRLLVKRAQRIEVEREKYPTRIFPRAAYPVEVVIKAREDFSGLVTEVLPKGITASNISAGGVIETEGQDKILIWQVNLRKGQEYRLSYTLHFPMIWPEFYEVGPLRFEDEAGRVVYQEKRYWQIVADAL